MLRRLAFTATGWVSSIHLIQLLGAAKPIAGESTRSDLEKCCGVLAFIVILLGSAGRSQLISAAHCLASSLESHAQKQLIVVPCI